MWILMNDAMLSVVADNNDASRLLVRARYVGDIEAVWPEAEVLEGEGTDYRYRAFLERSVVAQAILERVFAIDYGNFKNSVSCHRRHDLYSQFWLLARMDQDEQS